MSFFRKKARPEKKPAPKKLAIDEYRESVSAREFKIFVSDAISQQSRAAKKIRELNENLRTILLNDRMWAAEEHTETAKKINPSALLETLEEVQDMLTRNVAALHRYINIETPTLYAPPDVLWPEEEKTE